MSDERGRDGAQGALLKAGEPGSGRPSWVVVPARDEADHVLDCVAALQAAALRAPGPVHVVIVDDGSRDGTAALAARALDAWGPHHAVLPGPGRGVGWARRTGFDHALRAIGPDGPALVATTDADSTVAPDWLAVLHRRLDEGRPVVAGDVHLHPGTDGRLVDARAVRLRERLAALPADEAGAAHPHFAGSNLAFDVRALRAIGPLPTPRALEDQAILERCRRLGIPVLRDHHAVVVTSSRTAGRAPGGLAQALARDAAALPAT